MKNKDYKPKMYDIFIHEDTDHLLSFAGLSNTIDNCDMYELLTTNEGIYFNNDTYKPIGTNRYWGYPGFERGLILVRKSNGKRPRKSTIEKLIKQYKL